MTKPSPTNDLFVMRRGKLSRSSTPSGAVGMPGLPGPAHGEVEHRRDQRDAVMRDVITERHLSTVLQPIVDLQTGMAVGAEALSRFSGLPARPPDAWFSEAASLGLGVELELAAIAVALETLGRLPSRLFLSLNVSVATVVSKDLRGALAHVPAERLVLELTQDVAPEDCKALAKALQKLRAQGLRLAVDDAEQWRSSNITELEPDIIKLDVRGTQGINGNNARQVLGAALMRFGMGSSSVTLVAEGIETKAEFEILRSLGCRLGQGYYLGRPGRLRERAPRHGAAGQLWLDEELPITPAGAEDLDGDGDPVDAPDQSARA